MSPGPLWATHDHQHMRNSSSLIAVADFKLADVASNMQRRNYSTCARLPRALCTISDLQHVQDVSSLNDIANFEVADVRALLNLITSEAPT